MIKEYYIIQNGIPTGPYDVVMLVRKLRNGSLKPDTLLSLGETSEHKPASEWPELNEFFNDKKEERTDHAKHGVMKHHGLMQTLTNGWHFLQNNQVSTIFSGLLVLASTLLIGITYFYLPSSLMMMGYAACFVCAYFLLACYLLCILRMTRGQPVDFFYLKDRIVPGAGKLFLCSIIISLPAMISIVLITSPYAILSIIGLIIFAIPGLLMITVYTYAPLLILDQSYTVRDAMKVSRDAIVKGGIENIGLIFALYAINFIGAILAFLPLAITLPITMSAITESYDEFFA